ncbi:protealysin inhibitor emfourin [Streptomyces sp. NPDC001857]|uniref:protealysin inhibitor emfourin n=1 Tax=unclassified Streptomyces TaxID=2593676 RepID=UPI00332216DB
MRIQVTRSGGLLGTLRRAELDTSGRSDGAELERLAHEVLASAQAEAAPAPGTPDGYSYTVTVDDAHSAEFTDPGLSNAQLDLVERVLGEGA